MIAGVAWLLLYQPQLRPDGDDRRRVPRERALAGVRVALQQRVAEAHELQQAVVGVALCVVLAGLQQEVAGAAVRADEADASAFRGLGLGLGCVCVLGLVLGNVSGWANMMDGVWG